MLFYAALVVVGHMVITMTVYVNDIENLRAAPGFAVQEVVLYKCIILGRLYRLNCILAPVRRLPRTKTAQNQRAQLTNPETPQSFLNSFLRKCRLECMLDI